MTSARFIASSLFLFLFPSVAAAHVVLTDPVPRSGDNGLTMMPCGGVAAGAPTALMAGDMITVSWTVGQAHGGSLTIDFAPADDTGFRNYVLASEISDEPGMPTSIEVQLPDIDCEACTLRLVQVNPDEDDYYSCADISLSGASGGTTAADSSGGDVDTGGGSTEGGSTGGGSTGGDSGGESTDGGVTVTATATATVTATSASTGDDGSGGSDDSGASDDDDSSGCSCNSTGAPSGGLLLALAAIAIRPRRRSAA